MSITQIQSLLYYLGYYDGNVDGCWGQKSKTACGRFQVFHGLNVDGVPGPETQAKLKEAVAGNIFAVGFETIFSDGDDEKESFWADIPNFKRAEFACPCPRCGGFRTEPKEQLVRICQKVRDHFGAPFTITSGVRCQAHNDELSGSVSNSRHILGKAVDFRISGKNSNQVKMYLDTLVNSGELRYCYCIDEMHCHMDIS